MTQKEKDLLLLKDLCTRLPYKVRCKVDKINFEGELREIELSYNMARLYNVEDDESENVYVYDCKPYLFPISSITEEQKYTCPIGVVNLETFIKNESWTYLELTPDSILCFVEWLNKNQFDYRGLIPMGSAIDATNLGIYGK